MLAYKIENFVDNSELWVEKKKLEKIMEFQNSSKRKKISFN
jgi:hypothetical protein